jgi:hypothetical protein
MSETTHDYTRDKFDSLTEHTATRRGSELAPSVTASKNRRSMNDQPSPGLATAQLQRQGSVGGESDVSLNRSGIEGIMFYNIIYSCYDAFYVIIPCIAYRLKGYIFVCTGSQLLQTYQLVG